MGLGDGLLTPKQVQHLTGHAQFTAATLQHKSLQRMDRSQLKHGIDLLQLAFDLINATAEETMAEALAAALMLACGFRLELDDASTSCEHLKGFGNGISCGLIQQPLH